MSLNEAYREIAIRALDAAHAALAARRQEKATFLAYHAFESLGGALSATKAQPYPLKHQRKLNQFVALAQPYKFGRAVAALAITLASLRNRCLYPEEHPGGVVTVPKDVVPESLARSLLSRVGGIARSLSPYI